MNIIGIDLGKMVFHLVTMDQDGKIIGRKKLSCPQLLKHMATGPCSVVGMEASCGAHHLGRVFRDKGHNVRLIPAQFVRPFVKSQKNDYVDVEAIAEAVQRPTMRFRSNPKPKTNSISRRFIECVTGWYCAARA